jgi:alpha-glucosidase
LATNATHAGGYAELDVHNLWGMMEEKATHKAVQEVLPGKRPFLISRSTFPSSGNWSGHWVSVYSFKSSPRLFFYPSLTDEFLLQLGDNFSQWRYMYFSIQGILQFQLFQIPFVGADTSTDMFVG